MDLERLRFARVLKVVQGEGKCMHMIVDHLEVQTPGLCIQCGVDDGGVLLVDGGQPRKALQALGGRGVKVGEVEILRQLLALRNGGLQYS